MCLNLHHCDSRPRDRPFRVTPAVVANIRAVQQSRLDVHELSRRQGIVSAFVNAGLPPPSASVRAPVPSSVHTRLDRSMCAALSALVRRKALSLADTVQLWRGESELDRRPNKALDIQWLDILLHGYALQADVVCAASGGVNHDFPSARPPDPTPVKNHASALRYSSALERSLAEGQQAGTHLIVDTATALQWQALRYSPFGCVPISGIDPEVEARLIHNLTHPDAVSVNACSDQSQLPSLSFESVRRLALRIKELATKFPHTPAKMMNGDVKGAFRNIPVASSLACHFAGSFDDVTAVDLSLPFEWTGSPAHYGAFGGGISFLVARESPHSLDPTDSDSEPFFSYV